MKLCLNRTFTLKMRCSNCQILVYAVHNNFVDNVNFINSKGSLVGSDGQIHFDWKKNIFRYFISLAIFMYFNFSFTIIFGGEGLCPDIGIKLVSWYQNSANRKSIMSKKWEQLQRLSCPIHSKKISKFINQAINNFFRSFTFTGVISCVKYLCSKCRIKDSLKKVTSKIWGSNYWRWEIIPFTIKLNNESFLFNFDSQIYILFL